MRIYHKAHKANVRMTQLASPKQVAECVPETIKKPGLDYHKGADSVAALGSPIYATHSGVVAHVIAYEDALSGCWLEISRDGKRMTDNESYKHLRLGSITVKKGQSIKAGDQIGLQGSTGKSTGEHLHYEVYRNGRLVDPLPYAMGTEKEKDEETVKITLKPHTQAGLQRHSRNMENSRSRND